MHLYYMPNKNKGKAKPARNIQISAYLQKGECLQRKTTSQLQLPSNVHSAMMQYVEKFYKFQGQLYCISTIRLYIFQIFIYWHCIFLVFKSQILVFYLYITLVQLMHNSILKCCCIINEILTNDS